MEAVDRVGGYVVHQVTAVDSLKTGDQIQLHLDQVKISETKNPEPKPDRAKRPFLLCVTVPVLSILSGLRLTGWPAWSNTRRPTS